MADKPILPPIMERWHLEDPKATALDLMWRMHRYMIEYDRAAEELGGMSVNRLTELCDLWTGDHLPRTEGWGREMVTVRRQIAVELLTTKLPAPRLAQILHVTLEEFAASVTRPVTVHQWILWDEAVCDGADRRTAADISGATWETARRWANLRPWTPAAQELADLRKRTPAVDRWRPFFEQGMLPSEAHRLVVATDPEVTLASATNAFTVWRRSGGDAARTGTCARNGCTNTFERYNAQTRYCSDRCAWNADNDRRRQREQEASRRTVECGVCGTPFETTRSDRRYCGEKCGNVARTRRKRATTVTATERGILTATNPESTLGSTQPGEDAA